MYLKSMKKYLSLSFFLLLFIIILYQTYLEKTVIKGTNVDKILIIKNKRLLFLLNKNKILKKYKIALGKNPIGHKLRKNDFKTPEGKYFISSKNKKSRYYRSLKISYPNKRDKKSSNKLGTNPGGNIMIHGILNGFGWIGKFHRYYDWTKGCIAVTNKEIEEIWNVVKLGTKIEIHP